MAFVRDTSSLLVLCFILSGCAHTAPEQVATPFSTALDPAVEAWLAVEPPMVDPSWVLASLESPSRLDIPYRDIIRSDRPLPGSLSLGNASTGHLVRSVNLEAEGDYWYVLETHRSRDANYGTEQLAEVLEAAGRRVAAAFPGSRVPLGDSSSQTGGDLQRHASHNSGRDVDIPFFVQDAATLDRIPAVAFVTFGPGLVTFGSRFDVERNWLFVRSLLEVSEEVQWIFVSRVLRGVMLDHAIEIGEPDWMIARARDVMWQPGDSSPHDDHFHVRIYCSARDRLEGCVNYGPEWAWADHHNDEVAIRSEELLRGLDDDSLEVRQAVIRFLRRIEARVGGAALATRLADQPEPIQLDILRALRGFQTAEVGAEVLAMLGETQPQAVRLAALETLAAYPHSEITAELATLVRSEERIAETWVSRRAARALRDVQDPTIVGTLIDALGHSDPETRELVGQILGRTTGRVDTIDWSIATGAERDEARSDWRAWYVAAGALEREIWLSSAFAEWGCPVEPESVTHDTLTQLVDFIDDGDPIAFLATEMLVSLTGERAPPERYSLRRRVRHWEQVIERWGGQ